METTATTSAQTANQSASSQPSSEKKNNTLLIVILIVALSIIIPVSMCVVATAVGLFSYAVKEESIDSFADCVAAGYPVLESYPRQCNTPGGKSFTEEVVPPVEEPGTDDGDGDQSPEEQAENPDYYGRSTAYACDTDADCLVSGCNAEICQGTAEEEMFSICIKPDQSTPKEAGYSCGCLNNGCFWKK